MDNLANNEELEAFLIEAELVNQKVKALAENKLSPEEFDRLEALRAQDRRRREDYRLMKEREAEEAKRRGISGKGIGKDFKSFCRACHIEYVYETPHCLKCERPTMTQEERQKQLTEMVEDYKSKKLHREERKHKWEMWKKTKSMLWKKEAINYNKWDVYTDSEEQEKPETDPVLPKDDPNFKALELDMQQRKKRREEDSKKANVQKDRGNKAMAEGDYEKAVEHYTFALDYVKDNKTIYTNRALAYLKLKKYAKAIKDCNKVLDYIECFEKFTEVPDLAYKAYSRKALAHKERKEYKEALAAIEAGIKLMPKEQPGHKLKKEIENFLKHAEATEKLITSEQQRKKHKQLETEEQQQKAEAEKQEGESQPAVNNASEFSEEQIVKELAQQAQANTVQRAEQEKPVQSKTMTQAEYNRDPMQSIRRTLNHPTKQELELLLNLLLVQPDYKTAFISLGGIRKLLVYIADGNESGAATLLICHTMDGRGVAEKDVWDFGVDRIEQMISSLLGGTLKMEEYSRMEDLFELLVTLSQSEKHRTLLSTNRSTVDFLLQCYPAIITKYKKEMQLVSSFVIYCSNLCMGESLLKTELEKNLPGVFGSLSRILESESKQRRFIDLQKSSYNFISNLLTKESIREKVSTNDELLQLLVEKTKALPKHNDDFQESAVALLSLLANLTFQPRPELLERLKKLGLHNILYTKFVESVKTGDTLRLAVQVMSKLNYRSLELQKAWVRTFERLFSEAYQNQNITTQALRLFNNVYVSNPQTPLPHLDSLLPLLNLDDNEILFCNFCTLLGVWTDNELTSQQTHSAMRDYIKRLIFIAKERTGNMRKSAAILLAKVARNEHNKDIFTANHGMEVLKSVAHLVLGK